MARNFLTPEEIRSIGQLPLKLIDSGRTPPDLLYVVENTHRTWLIRWDTRPASLRFGCKAVAVWDDQRRTVSEHDTVREAHLAVIELDRPKVLHNLWVCDDCMLAHANGEDPPDRPAGEPAVWALWAGRVGHVTMGLLREEHADGCDPDSECDCETREFSRTACDGCGSVLHGTRHAFSWWDR